MKNWKPIFFENNKLPIFLSLFAPIKINAIIIFCFVFSRSSMDEQTKRHETIHFQQYLETFIIGFWIIYLYDYLIGLMKYKNGKVAYTNIRAEREAYTHDMDDSYLSNRKRYSWLFNK